MHATCKADVNPLFPTTRMSRNPIVELAKQFGLLLERPKPAGLVALGRLYEKSDEEVSHDLINPLLYFDKAALALKQGFVKARSGQELRVEAAIGMFENYLGIAQHKEQAAITVKNLHADRRERRAARRLQSKKMLMRAVSKMQMVLLDDQVRELKKMYVEDYGVDPADVEKASPQIAAFAVLHPLIQPDFQMLFRRHTQTRRARPDMRMGFDLGCDQCLCDEQGGGGRHGGELRAGDACGPARRKRHRGHEFSIPVEDHNGDLVLGAEAQRGERDDAAPSGQDDGARLDAPRASCFSGPEFGKYGGSECQPKNARIKDRLLQPK
jgi:hypothetical protein